MAQGWLTFTDFSAGRAIAIRVPVGHHWEGVSWTVHSEAVTVWRTEAGEPAVIDMQLDASSGLPPDEDVVDGLPLRSVLHGPTLGPGLPGMTDGVVWSSLDQ